MKKIVFYTLLAPLLCFSQQQSLQRVWGTYFGDERYKLEDSVVDRAGNLYLVGLITSNVDTAPVFASDVYQSNYGGGFSDGFIAKFNNQGQLLYITYFGGVGDDVVSCIDFDNSNNIYVAGFTDSETQIATATAFQTNKSALNDLFVAKFNEEGLLQWSTYYGGNGNDGSSLFLTLSMGIDSNRIQLAHDGANHFYAFCETTSSNMGTANTFQPTKENANFLIVKFSNDGIPQWSTYHGFNENNQLTAIKANEEAVYLSGQIRECVPDNIPNTYYATPNAFQPTRASCQDLFLTKFDTNGQRLWSTYYGGNSLDLVSDRSIDVRNNAIYFAGQGLDQALATSDTFQETPSVDLLTPFLVRFNELGERIWGTFNGTTFNQTGATASNSGHVKIDNENNLIFSGTVGLNANVAQGQAFQTSLNGTLDGFLAKFDETGQKIWGTYYGGNNTEIAMIAHPFGENVFVVGESNSITGLATTGAMQPNLTLFDPSSSETNFNIFIGYLTPIPLSTNENQELSFEMIPNPSAGNTIIRLPSNVINSANVTIFDISGKTIYESTTQNEELRVQLDGLSSGVYFVKVATDNTAVVKKWIVKN
ncbi:T9SS type A sorting domain-containing protein [Flavobacterium sp.]|uniref:T9SS type A sorting domain-containing protein n=1 Tax=Flavobacterium sp. TaxID=239 RepID=UPI002605CFCF|nr:T9SS type A sorting domain-containing protein [Flavobacterium sp.]